MEWWEAVLLGAVQGLFMFVPVSSTSHLVVTQHVLIATGSDLPSPGAAEMVLFDLVVHVGTLVSIVIVLRASLLNWARGLLASLAEAARPRATSTLAAHPRRSRWLSLRLGLLGVLTVGITGSLGLVLYDLFAAVFERPLLIALTLAVTGAVLWSTDRLPPGRRGLRRLGPGTAATVGLAQALSLLPGISRSGTTIAAGLYSGLRRRWAAEYSFLIAIPTILAATAVQARSVAASDEQLTIGFPALVIGFVVAAVVGTYALRLVLVLLYRARLRYFSYYVWTVAAGVLVFVLVT
jgi:undecaprenyl-diphosphatase